MVKIFSILVRNFLLPNPFECCGNSAFVINHFAGWVIGGIAYWLVGLDYRRGSNPSKGSFRFLLIYAILTLMLWGMGRFRFAWWSILGIIVLGIGIISGIKRLIEHIECHEDWRDY